MTTAGIAAGRGPFGLRREGFGLRDVGLHVHSGTDLSELEAAAADRIAASATDPFVPVRVATASRAAADRLTAVVAGRAGIAANIVFSRPMRLLAEIARGVLGAPLPDEAAMLRAWLALTRDQSFVAELGPYERRVRAWADGAVLDADAWEFVRHAATAFTRYGAERPDWVAGAARGVFTAGAERLPAWQQTALARLARDENSPFVGPYLDSAMDALARGATPPVSAAVLYGAASLPVVVLPFVAALSTRMRIDMYLAVPTLGFMGDLRTRPPPDPEADEGDWHPVVGRYGRTLIHFAHNLWRTCDPTDHTVGEAPAGVGALAALQIDADRPGDPDAAAATAVPHDQSVTIIEAPGLRRQVETLKIELLAALDADPTLAPRDIAVLTADLEGVVPLVTEVFAAAPALPVRFAERSLRRTDGAAAAVLDLQALARGRAPVADVIDVLRRPVVASRFDIGEADGVRAVELLEAAQARWGVSRDDAAAEGLPDSAMHTLQRAVDRLLLSFALEPPAAFAGFSAAVDPERDDADLTARLDRFVRALVDVRTRLAAPLRPAAVPRRIDDLVRLLDDTGPHGDGVREVRMALSEAFSPFHDERFTDALLDASAAAAIVTEALDRPSRVGDRVADAVAVAAFRPMRAVPHRIVAMLGMDDGVFPRADRPAPLDATIAAPRVGDRSTRDDDRLSFLEALCAARERLIITYGSAPDGRGTPSAAAGPVADLTARLDALGGDGTAEARTRRAPTRGYDPSLFDPAAPQSYDPTALAAAVAVEGADAVPVSRRQTLHAAPAVHVPAIVTPQALARWFERPQAAFLQHRLGLRLDDRREPPAAREPVVIDALLRAMIGDRLIALWRAGGDEQAERALYERFVRDGRVAPGTGGEASFAVVRAAARRLFEASAAYGERDRTPVRVDRSFGPVTVRGVVNDVWTLPDGARLVHAAFRTPRARIVARVWIEWLCATTADERVRDAELYLRPQGRRPALWGIISAWGDESNDARLERCVALFADGHRVPPRFRPHEALLHQRALGFELPDGVLDRSQADAVEFRAASVPSLPVEEEPDPAQTWLWGEEPPGDDAEDERAFEAVFSGMRVTKRRSAEAA